MAANTPDQVLFVIMTDGQENSSREFDRQRIMEMVEDRQKTADYEFIYLGANQDAYTVGDGMGIRGGRSLDYAASPGETRSTMDKLSWNVKAHRRLGEKKLASHEFFSEELESLGKESWDEHKAKRDTTAARPAAGRRNPGATVRGHRHERRYINVGRTVAAGRSGQRWRPDPRARVRPLRGCS